MPRLGKIADTKKAKRTAFGSSFCKRSTAWRIRRTSSFSRSKWICPKNVRLALIELFKVLATPPEERDPYMDESLAAFPYVNGGLFEDEKIEIPNFTDEILQLLLQNASEDFDWSGISPTIFGAVFESTLNPETRRAGGMHYTSIENIHRVIDPLFLDDLKKELEEIKETKQTKTRKQKLSDFQKKLSSLTFLDEAVA
ncbi:MAG: hypothetical protein IJR37_04085 [Schwartzia sp.]|nr:hypothetical protein [Schwartzia sp. (in: firmicutes)]